MKKYKIINDTGVPYSFIGDYTPWLNQIVNGAESPVSKELITIEKPHGQLGWFTTDKENLEEI